MQGIEPAKLRAAVDVVQRAPYLKRLCELFPETLAELEHEHPGIILARYAEASRSLLEEADETAFRHRLRVLKSRAALAIAIADISGTWTVEETTRNLTLFADAAVESTVSFLLLQAARSGKVTLKDEANPTNGCGYVVLGMGKHGAHELNYSSDIDLIILFDPETAPLAEGVEPSTFVRLTRNLVSILQDITEDGYVFRVDLRLRPDPRATQVAIALEAAAIYYENLGQNWERAAMIKARPVAGDIALGREFLDRLKSYIWRKYLDFAAIADVQSLKRQIHAVKGHGEIAVRGHNVKLGRGGIREIEFFVQTQQLIAGGRNPDLRGQQTIPMLAALAKAEWINAAAADELTEAYRFLRMLEHRVQMLEDAQDHCIPASEPAFENFARLAGFDDGNSLAEKLTEVLQCVQSHYQALFESADELGAEGGSLVFTGGEDDPDTIATLERMGFKSASEVAATIRGWHFGRYNATRTKRSRELLTELMPKLLSALSTTGDPDQAFLAFNTFIEGLPAGVQLFSMLKANPQLLDLIARILGTAPRLAAQLSRQPRILEAVLERGFFGPLPPREDLRANADALITPSLSLEEAMDRARILAREQNFRVGVRILSETMSAEEAGHGFSNVADTVLASLLGAVTRDMEQQFGRIPGSSCVIMAMGKLGGREMTAGSDLDLILVYDAEPNAVSDGPRQLQASQFFAKLSQRLISSLTAPTPEGILYEVDMRLRPSGSQGPVAVSFQSFAEYQKHSAWTWEKMALTRARCIAGDSALKSRVGSEVAATLAALRDRDVTLRDIRDMRALMLKEHKSSSRWDIKRKPGGLVDVEFCAQALQLIHAHELPSVLHQNTGEALLALRDQGRLTRAAADTLLEAFHLYGRLTQLLRLCLDGNFDPDTSTPALIQAVCHQARMPDLRSTTALLDELAEKTREIFNSIIGQTAP
jgi:[glutamine synthetase] adenylyltransferase / [glutamine synthetase]-adenylyl-L-tyrosine phosphorylase